MEFTGLMSGRVGDADFACDAAGFVFERADGKVRTIAAVTKIMTAPLFESTAPLALRDVNEIMQNQFAIVPGINPNNERVTETHATRVFGDDADAFRGFRQFRVLRERNPINHQHSDPAAILHTDEIRVARMPGSQWIPARENEIFLRFCPLMRERQ